VAASLNCFAVVRVQDDVIDTVDRVRGLPLFFAEATICIADSAEAARGAAGLVTRPG
jgi:hypothetical protein